MNARSSFGLLVVATIVACGEPDDPAWRINKTRVLGAQVMVDAEPERASVRPGEAFHVDWLVMNVDGPADVPYRLAVCRRKDLVMDAECDGPNFVEVSGSGKVPSIAVTAPGDLGSTTHLMINGTVGERDVVLSVPIETGPATINRNPHIAKDAIRLDDAPWDVEDGACGAGLPEIVADEGKHVLEVKVSGDDREPTSDGLRETMQLSHFTTAGELDGQFSIVDAEAPPGDVELSVPWIAKRGHATPEGKVVRFYFALRDSRGGLSFTTRALCMRPQP